MKSVSQFQWACEAVGPGPWQLLCGHPARLVCTSGAVPVETRSRTLRQAPVTENAHLAIVDVLRTHAV